MAEGIQQAVSAAPIVPQQQVIFIVQQDNIGSQAVVPIQQNNIGSQAVVAYIKAPPNTTYKDWYLLSIKNKQYNKCSCTGCSNISAYNAAMGWLGYDLVFCIFQMIVWIFSNASDLFSLFLIAFLVLAATNIMTILAIKNLNQSMVMVKLPCFIVTCILVWIETIMIAPDNLADSPFFYTLLFVVAMHAMCAFLAIKDVYKIYKWITYYEKGGPYVLILP
eukprot:1002335_1